MDIFDERPKCELIGQNGNIFNLVSIAANTLRSHGYRDEAEELTHRIWNGEAKSYYHAINIIEEYVDII